MKNEKVYERIVRVVSKEDADHLDRIYETEKLIRCKDCKYADKTEREGEYRCCFHPEEIVIADFYCGDGKAK